MKIGIYYGTETGNSEMLAEDMVEALGDGFTCDIASLGDVDPAALDPAAFHIFITSTYGTGDLPTTAQPFETALKAAAPDLSAIRFAIFGLGDQVFSETFNHGSQRLMQMLLDHKAQMVGERGLHDASAFDMPEDIALPWLEDIRALITQDAA